MINQRITGKDSNPISISTLVIIGENFIGLSRVNMNNGQKIAKMTKNRIVIPYMYFLIPSFSV